MHRLLVETELLEQETPVLSKEALNHLKVLRPKDGEAIELFDGKGKWREFSFRSGKDSASPLSVTSQIFQASRPSFNLILFACVTKGSRWDWTIEKATELGVTRIVPVISDRTIVRLSKAERAAKRERWQRIAEDAARQSDAKWVPEICEVVDFKDALPLVKETTCFIGALTTPPFPSLLEAVKKSRTVEGEVMSSERGEQSPIEGGARIRAEAPEEDFCHRVHLSTFIGPEGDFTPEELSALMAIATPTSFGPTILRAETAAIYALSVISAICYNIRPS